jgi:DNA-binding transcriptional LysR family regulator
MRRFTLSQLEALLWIYRLGSFQAAANKLNVTQPTISLRIRELEKLLDARVFEHRRSAIQLTPPGAVLLQYAERGIELFDEMAERLKTHDPLRGLLRLGSADMFAMTSLPAILRRLEALFPRLKIELTVDHSVMLNQLLASGQLDVGFLNNPKPTKNIAIEKLSTLEVAWVSGAPQHIGKKILEPSDFAGRTIYSPPRPSPLSEMIVNWFAEANQKLPPVSTCNNISVIARLLANGNGMGTLPVNVIAQELQSGMLVRYRARPALPALIFCAAYQRQAHGPGIEAIVKTARDVIRQSGLVYHAP